MEFSSQEKELLSKYVTNTEGDVFVFKNLPEVVKGALFSRYSRTSKTARRLLLDEFLNNTDEVISNTTSSFVEPNDIDQSRAESFYDRILVGYGDDSVAELAGVHIGIENVSQMIAAKALEGNRIGISPLEKSTRYVRYDDKENGLYRYYRGRGMQEMDGDSQDVYINTMDTLFETYSGLLSEMEERMKEKFPRDENLNQRVYTNTIRAKACDICRELLPLGTLTNLGLYGNGRAFEYLITKMQTHDSPEVHDLAMQMDTELKKVIPSFVKRATNNRGKATANYMSERDTRMKKLEAPVVIENARAVRLHNVQELAQSDIATALIFENTVADYSTSYDHNFSYSWTDLMNDYTEGRQNRHHKVGRAFETIPLTFEIVSDIGTYKDLQRHRMLTPFVQDYTTIHGYDVPKEIVEYGYENDYRRAMDTAAVAYERLRAADEEVMAKYVIPLGYRMRWLWNMNMREASHIIELRSTAQGHPGYRWVAHEMAKRLEEEYSVIAPYLTQFTDYREVDLERLEAENKAAKKMGL